MLCLQVYGRTHLFGLAATRGLPILEQELMPFVGLFQTCNATMWEGQEGMLANCQVGASPYDAQNLSE